MTKHTDYGLLCRGGLFYAALTRISANQHRPWTAPACDPGGLNGGLLTHLSEKPTQVHRHAEGSPKSPPRSWAGGGGEEGLGGGRGHYQATKYSRDSHAMEGGVGAGDQQCTVMQKVREKVRHAVGDRRGGGGGGGGVYRRGQGWLKSPRRILLVCVCGGCCCFVVVFWVGAGGGGRVP